MLVNVDGCSSSLSPLPTTIGSIRTLRDMLRGPGVNGFSQIRAVLSRSIGVVRHSVRSRFLRYKESSLTLLFFSKRNVGSSFNELCLTDGRATGSGCKGLVHSASIRASFVRRTVAHDESHRGIIVLSYYFDNTFKRKFLTGSSKMMSVRGRLKKRKVTILALSASLRCSFRRRSSRASVCAHCLIRKVRAKTTSLSDSKLVSDKRLRSCATHGIDRTTPTVGPGFFNFRRNFQVCLSRTPAGSPALRCHHTMRRTTGLDLKANRVSRVSRRALAILESGLKVPQHVTSRVTCRILRPCHGGRRDLRGCRRTLGVTLSGRCPLLTESRSRLERLRDVLKLRGRSVGPVRSEFLSRERSSDFLASSGRRGRGRLRPSVSVAPRLPATNFASRMSDDVPTSPLLTYSVRRGLRGRHSEV